MLWNFLNASRVFTLLLLLTATSICAADDTPKDSWPPERKVFAHYVPWHPPSHARPDRTADAAPGSESQIVHAAAAGIDGFAIDVVAKPPVRMVGQFLQFAKIAQQHAPGFAIMPCLDCAAVQSADEWAEFLQEWLKQAGKLASTYRVNGAVVVFTYGAYQMPPADWIKVRETLLQAGHRLFLIGEMNGYYRTHADPLSRIREYADVFDGLYFFGPNSEEHERKLLSIQRSDGQPLLRIYSPSPGYWRVNTGSFARRYQGTRTYRDAWDLACRLPVHWASITTWNDYTEHTHVEPSRNFSDVYARLTRVGAASFRRESIEPAIGSPTFWLTAPAEMPDGPGPSPLEASTERENLFEVLRIGPALTKPCPVRVTIARPDGEVIVEKVLNIAAGKQLADEQFVWQPDRRFDEPYLLVTAAVEGTTATLPLPLWPRNLARRYYMSPRRVRLATEHPPKPVIALDGDQLTVSTIPGPPNLRTDLLHNLMPMLDPKSHSSRVAEGLLQLPRTKPGWGFWEAAVVTPDASVTWADPVYVAPQGDLEMLALHRFDSPEHATTDQSLYERHGRKRGSLAELADGSFALVSNDQSWFEPSGSFCPATAPVTVELWARPDSAGGILWGDVGAAMLLSVTDDGKPQARRRTYEQGKWIAATAKQKLPLKEWSHVAGVFDGESLALYVNSVLVARTKCTGASGSSRMAVGRNPYNMTSIFTGMIDDVRITARALQPSEFGPVNPADKRPANPAPSP